MKSMKELRLEAPSGLPIYHCGPPIEKGPLPAFFYFALSGSESLNLDPYNQPIQFLQGSNIRTFSFSLPGHLPGDDHRRGMQRWAEGLQQSPDYFEEYLQQATENIDYLIATKWIDPSHIAVGGLSRGGFLATRLAARHVNIKLILGFAPLTNLQTLHEFSQLHVEHLSLEQDIPQLRHKTLRYYIGNRDTRVDTNRCFSFIHQLTNAIFDTGIRSPPIEMILFPSIGHKGHGTPPLIFEEGATWIKNQLTKHSQKT